MWPCVKWVTVKLVPYLLLSSKPNKMNEMGHLGYFLSSRVILIVNKKKKQKKNMTLQTWQWGSVREGENNGYSCFENDVRNRWQAHPHHLTKESTPWGFRRRNSFASRSHTWISPVLFFDPPEIKWHVLEQIQLVCQELHV